LAKHLAIRNKKPQMVIPFGVFHGTLIIQALASFLNRQQ